MEKYKQSKVIITGSDSVELDSPTFEVINVNIDMLTNVLTVEIMHEVSQGTLTQKHSRTFEVKFSDLSKSVKTTGLAFLDAIEGKILELPQYVGSVKA